ncbi:Uncharacterised protein [uncultured archaeon]|nr:Uncharacterised protein [uncultured archaeon]
MVNMREVFSWIKIFAVSFIVVALLRYVFEIWLGVEHNWTSISLSAGLVAVAFATAQWVLRPQPKPSGMHDVLVSTPPAAGQAASAWQPEPSDDSEVDLGAFFAGPPASGMRKPSLGGKKSKAKAKARPKAKAKRRR